MTSEEKIRIINTWTYHFGVGENKSKSGTTYYGMVAMTWFISDSIPTMQYDVYDDAVSASYTLVQNLVMAVAN